MALRGFWSACQEEPARRAVVLPNSRELLEVLLAIMQAGWQYTALNAHLNASEVAYILENSGARAFFAHARHAEAAPRAGLAAAGPPGGPVHAVHVRDGRPAQGRDARHPGHGAGADGGRLGA